MVEGFVGRPGAGKTLSMVHQAFRLKKLGKRKIYANIPLVDKRVRKTREYFFFGKVSVSPRSKTGYGSSWADGHVNAIEEILLLDNATILLDEVHMWMPSTDWGKIPFEVRLFLAQQRKEGIDIWWTAQAQARVFNVIRELTACLWRCQRYGGLSILRGCDPEDREDMGKRVMWIGPDTWNFYDTSYMVGSGDGKSRQAGVGRNQRYAESAEVLGMQAEGAQASTGWVRYENDLGYVRYRRDDKQRPQLEMIDGGRRTG